MVGPSEGNGGTNGMVFMCTGIQPDTKQNELYLATKKLNATFIRDKNTKTYDLRTTHLVVGSLLKTEKFLCALAAGIPLVGEDFIWESEREGRWLQDKIQEFDIGNPEHPMRTNSKFFIPTLSERQAVKASGGTFKEWHVVVLIENKDGNRQQEIYRRLLEIGGAKVERWTIKHLQDQMKEIEERQSKLKEMNKQLEDIKKDLLDIKKKIRSGKEMRLERKEKEVNCEKMARKKAEFEDHLRAVTLDFIISHPNMLINPINQKQGDAFQELLNHNDRTAKVPVVAYVFVGDCLTKEVWPKAQNYNIKEEQIIRLLCSGERKTEMLKAHLEDN